MNPGWICNNILNSLQFFLPNNKLYIKTEFKKRVNNFWPLSLISKKSTQDVVISWYVRGYWSHYCSLRLFKDQLRFIFTRVSPVLYFVNIWSLANISPICLPLQRTQKITDCLILLVLINFLCPLCPLLGFFCFFWTSRTVLPKLLSPCLPRHIHTISIHSLFQRTLPTAGEMGCITQAGNRCSRVRSGPVVLSISGPNPPSSPQTAPTPYPLPPNPPLSFRKDITIILSFMMVRFFHRGSQMSTLWESLIKVKLLIHLVQC